MRESHTHDNGYMALLDLFRRDSLVASFTDTSVGIATPFTPADYDSPLTRLTWAELFPNVDPPVGRKQAMEVAPIAKSRHMLAGMISRFPLIEMTGRDRAQQQSPLVRQPEIGRPLATSLTWWLDSLLFYGRAWLEIVERYAEDSRPRRVRWVPEHRISLDEAGTVTHVAGNPVGPMDVIRIDGPHEGILNFGAARIREAIEINRAAARAAANPVPSIELHQTAGTPLTDDQIDALTARWGAARAGQNGGVAYTNQSIEAKTHGQAAEQLLIAARNYAAVDMARLCGMPAWAVDAVVEGSSMTYNNTPGRTRELIDYGLQPYMTAIEQRLSLDDVLPAGRWARFDTSAVLQLDFEARMRGYKSAIDAGVYTAEECRQLEAGHPLEEARA